MKLTVLCGVLSFASASLRAIEAEQEIKFWARTSLTLRMVKNYGITDFACYRSREYFVGCRAGLDALKEYLGGNDKNAVSEVDFYTNRSDFVAKREAWATEYDAMKAGNRFSFAAAWRALEKDPRLQELRKGQDAYLAAKAMNAFLSNALDPHSYIQPLLVQGEDEEIDPDAPAGIGITVFQSDKGPIIAYVDEGSPAQKSGLMAGDYLLEVDGEKTNEIPFQRIRMLLRNGPEKSYVSVAVRREQQVYVNHIQRARIEESVFVSQMLRQGDLKYGYLKLSSLTDEEVACFKFKEKVEELEKAGAEGWVLDLRDNGGGGAMNLRCVASAFLPADVTIGVYQTVWQKTRDYYFGTLKSFTPRTQKPVVLLVNSYTASFAELLASSLRDHGVALIVGEPTFGKGTVQTVSRVNVFARGFEEFPASVVEELGKNVLIMSTSMYMFSPKTQVTHQLVKVQPDIEAYPTPAASEAQKLRMREENIFVNPVPPVGPAYEDSPARQQSVAYVKECLSRTSRAKDTFERASIFGQSPLPDFQAQLGRDSLLCFIEAKAKFAL